MQVQAYINGILPRSDFALETGSALLKGRETKENFERILEKETQNLISIQETSGLNYITDGQLFWHDFLRPIAQALSLHSENSNADENPVTRQIYTNTFYRKPLILQKIKNPKKPLISKDFFDIIPKNKRKAILPSPFSLVYLSDGMHRNENGTLNEDVFAELLVDAALALNEEAKRLEKDSDVSFIQFNEPCMCYANEAENFFDDINNALEAAVNGLKAITSLHLYNGDASKFFPQILKFPVKRIGIDAYSTDLSKFANNSFKKFLELGIVNSKNSLIEEPEAIAEYGKQVLKKINPEGLALVPNRPLELVPQHIAIEKIKSLAKGAELLN
ncbi:hypothetical protein HYX01_00195 [Candidatus Woesearchaeota archaeon]|nr:hypothetical protein [Candidatus Woesearchaeota archaeon]